MVTGDIMEPAPLLPTAKQCTFVLIPLDFFIPLLKLILPVTEPNKEKRKSMKGLICFPAFDFFFKLLSS